LPDFITLSLLAIPFFHPGVIADAKINPTPAAKKTNSLDLMHWPLHFFRYQGTDWASDHAFFAGLTVRVVPVKTNSGAIAATNKVEGSNLLDMLTRLHANSTKHTFVGVVIKTRVCGV
jgi:hypothetical protein